MDTSTIATYRWNYDTSVSTYGSNNWTTSEFNTVNLNTNYWNYLGTTWQNLIATTTSVSYTHLFIPKCPASSFLGYILAVSNPL